MSLSAEILSAATEAQAHLAQIGGAAPGTTNFTLGGANYTGVLNEATYSSPLVTGGVEQIRELRIVATRDQFAVKPDPARRPLLAALGARWIVTAVGESGVHYFLTCRPTD